MYNTILIGRILVHAVFVVIALLFILGCTSRDKMKDVVTNYQHEAEKLGDPDVIIKAVEDDLRQEIIQEAINQRIIRKVSNDEKALGLTPERVLCRPRSIGSELRVRISSAREFSAALADLVTPMQDEWTPLIKAMGTDYKARLKTASDHAQFRAKNARSMANKECQNDITNYVYTTYPLKPMKEEEESLGDAASALGAIKDFSEFLYDSLNAVLKEGTKEVIDLKRGQALHAFIKDPSNLQAITKDIKAIRDQIALLSLRKRNLAIAGLVQGLRDLRVRLIEVTSDSSLDKNPSCSEYWSEHGAKVALDELKKATRETDDLTIKSAAYQSCYASIVSSIKPNLVGILSNASLYDKEADAAPGQSTEGLLEAVNRLAKLDDKDEWESAKAVFEVGMRWAGIADKARKAIADEDFQKQYSDRLNAMEKAMRGL